MSVEARTQPEGLRMYDELIAVHTIMRRSTALTTTALHGVVSGDKVRISALVRIADWQHGFIHHHHTSEDEQFWPVLRGLFPDAVIADDADAACLGLNGVSDGRNVVLPAEATGLAAQLAQRGYRTIPVDMSELRKSGGGPKCCTMELRPEPGH